MISPLNQIKYVIIVVCFLIPNLSHAKVWQSYQEVGSAQLKVLFWSIYTAHLYSNDGTYQENKAPLVLRLIYHRNISQEELKTHTKDQWLKLYGEDNRYDNWLIELGNIWPSITPNDELILLMNPDGKCQFFSHIKLLGSIENKALCQRFSGIWLSPLVSDKSLRNKLIGRIK